jgi:hypothetical protein
MKIAKSSDSHAIDLSHLVMQALRRIAKLTFSWERNRSVMYTHLEQLLSQYIPIIKLGLYADCDAVFPDSRHELQSRHV